MRHVRTIVAALACLIITMSTASAQQVEVKRVSSDSLVRFIKTRFNEKVYFLKDAEDVSDYSVSADSKDFVKAALSELGAKGYTVSSYGGSWFVSRGNPISASLPVGFFDQDNSDIVYGDGEESNTQVTFQNKIYEIGEYKEGRKGKAYVQGYVRDAASGEPIVGVAVHSPDGTAYSVTDSYGFYRLQLPVGDNRLNFSGYSLEELQLNLLVHDDGGLDVTMKEMVTTLNGAVVSAESVSHHRDSRMGIEKVRMNTIRKIPSAFGEADVIKAVLTLPGVKTVGEASSGFNVRGGAVDQNLILFNDGTVFNPSHLFGIFSAFNPDIVNEMELYKSSIPAEFGGRISSVLDIHSKEGNSNKLTGTIGLGMLTSSFSLEGPIAKGKTTFVLGGRTTYSNWILNMLPENSGYNGGKASFSDINAGITHRFNERNTLHANVYWSADRFSFSGDTTFRYSNLNASVKLRSQLSLRHTMTLSGGIDGYSNRLDDNCNPYTAYTLATDVRQAHAKADFSYSIGQAHKLSYGAQGIFYDMNPGTTTAIGDKSFFEGAALDKENAVEAAAYAGDTWSPDRRVAVEYGTRFTAFLNHGTTYMAPDFRISGKYSFRDNLSLKAGFNSMHQNIHMLTNSSSISPMDTWKISDERIRPQSGWQAASGLYWTVADNKVDLSLEGYWKQMSRYLDYKSGAQLSMNPNLADDLVETRGKAYGVEVMARKTLGKLNGWVSYTWSRALLQEMEDRGIETINGGKWYSAPHDKPHDFKLVGNYMFTHRYSLSINIDYSTGRPVTIPIAKYWYKNGWRLAYSERNSYRIPDYFRMDMAFNIDPGHYLKQLAHMTVTLGVYNVTGRKNAYSIYYTNQGGASINGYKISVFACPVPYINLNLKF